MERTGQSLRRLSGWSPRTRHWTDADGTSWSQTEPELDWADVAILSAWQALNESLCGVCGRPRELHRAVDDYQVAFDDCPAMIQLDRAQTDWQVQLEEQRDKARERGDMFTAMLRPERARLWSTYTDDEGTPT